MLQCLERCRQEVCEKLKLQPSDIELSMGMSQDYEQAVRFPGPRKLTVQTCCTLSAAALLHATEDSWMTSVVCIEADDLGLTGKSVCRLRWGARTYG